MGDSTSPLCFLKIGHEAQQSTRLQPAAWTAWPLCPTPRGPGARRSRHVALVGGQVRTPDLQTGSCAHTLQ